MNAELIERSLELAADTGTDLTPHVYRRLFAAHPDMEALFVRDTNGSVRGEMLARVFEMILDFIDRRAYGAQMIQCEVVTHEGYGVPPDVFRVFFETVADTLKDVLGDEWTATTNAAWRDLLAEMNWYATHPAQSLAAQVPA
jgi:hemoglobin-like flavoprotein